MCVARKEPGKKISLISGPCDENQTPVVDIFGIFRMAMRWVGKEDEFSSRAYMHVCNVWKVIHTKYEIGIFRHTSNQNMLLSFLALPVFCFSSLFWKFSKTFHPFCTCQQLNYNCNVVERWRQRRRWFLLSISAYTNSLENGQILCNFLKDTQQQPTTKKWTKINMEQTHTHNTSE